MTLRPPERRLLPWIAHAFGVDDLINENIGQSPSPSARSRKEPFMAAWPCRRQPNSYSHAVSPHLHMSRRTYVCRHPLDHDGEVRIFFHVGVRDILSLWLAHQEVQNHVTCLKPTSNFRLSMKFGD